MHASGFFWGHLDVLLEVASFLSFRDALALRLSCRAAYSLEETAAFWKLLLQDLARRRPLPIPLWDDPFGLFTASVLRTIVRHAIKIDRTFSGKEAKPVSTSMMQLPRNFDIHTVLSGTSIALLHNTQTGKLICKDLVTGKASDQMEIERYILGDSDFSVSRGAAKIVFRTGVTEGENLSDFMLRVYEISHRDGAPVLRQLWTRSIPVVNSETDYDVFVDGDVVGLVHAMENVRLQAWNMETQASVDFTFGGPDTKQDKLQACTVIERRLCLNFSYTDANTKHRFLDVAVLGPDALPYGDSTSPGEPTWIHRGHVKIRDSYLLTMSHAAFCGGSQTMISWLTPGSGRAKPRLDLASLSYFADPPERLRQDFVCAHHTGDSVATHQVAESEEANLLAWDGPTFAFMLQTGPKRHSVLLARVDHADRAEPRSAAQSVSLTTLSVSPKVNLQKVQNMSVDGRLGIVYLQAGGEVSRICYI